MKRDKPSKEFDLLAEVEKRLGQIEERMSDVEEKTKKSIRAIQEYVFLGDEINRELIYFVLQMMFLLTKTERKTSDFDDVIDAIERMERAIKQGKDTGLAMPPVVPSAIINIILTISKSSNISFEEIAPYLISKFGKEYAWRNVKKELIMQLYGSEALIIWEKLFKE